MYDVWCHAAQQLAANRKGVELEFRSGASERARGTFCSALLAISKPRLRGARGRLSRCGAYR
ncbi:hypothetical protein Mal33_54620 [Rosistilla oblonga]|uniref:Uncharacterized protein n=1 Tax=Rosistilla oblonga TaxID=2527990 RepID=A0A518J269_9BACT|nr:hypothetical protein Mal33_54620 [Rosistilla oblonga]